MGLVGVVVVPVLAGVVVVVVVGGTVLAGLGVPVVVVVVFAGEVVVVVEATVPVLAGAVVVVVDALPLTPNGIGVREFSYIYLLQPLGVSNAMAVAFSLWDYILTFFYGLIGGILYLLKK